MSTKLVILLQGKPSWRHFACHLPIIKLSSKLLHVINWSVIAPYVSVTSHSWAPYGLFSSCFEQKSYVHSRGPHGARAAPYECCLPARGPLSFNACIISLRAPYGFRYCKQPVNRARTGPVKGPYGQIRRPCGIVCQLWLCQFPYLSVRAPYGTLAGHARAPYGSRRIWKTLKIPWGARTMPAWASHGVPVDSCELFNQTICMQTCQAERGP